MIKNKFKLMILTMVLLIGVMLPITSINAIMHHDYKHIDDITYISVIHNYDNQVYYPQSGFFGQEFQLSYTGTTNIYGINSEFETLSQVGTFNIYFDSNLLIDDFSDEYGDFILTITNHGGFSYDYYPYSVDINKEGSIYNLSADFELGLMQDLTIASNTWTFNFQIVGDFKTGDYINVYSLHNDKTSSFSWSYYKDFDSIMTDYERGWVDGYGAGFDTWYEGRYELGLDEGYDLGYDKGRADYGQYFLPGSHDVFSGWHGFQDGYDYGLDIGYTNGLRDGEIDEVIAKMDTWIVPAIILVLIGGGFIAFAKYRGSKNE